MIYPKDFTPFEGKALSSKEINTLLQKGLVARGKDEAHTVATGDTMIEIDEEGNVLVWQLRAERIG